MTHRVPLIETEVLRPTRRSGPHCSAGHPSFASRRGTASWKRIPYELAEHSRRSLRVLVNFGRIWAASATPSAKGLHHRARRPSYRSVAGRRDRRRLERPSRRAATWRPPTCGCCPRESAQRKGKRTVEQLLAAAVEKRGKYPDVVGVVLWGSEMLESDVASGSRKALDLLGAKIAKDPFGRAERCKLIPLAELGRPRIDILRQHVGGLQEYVPRRDPSDPRSRNAGGKRRRALRPEFREAPRRRTRGARESSGGSRSRAVSAWATTRSWVRSA